jgi:galactokinase
VSVPDALDAARAHLDDLHFRRFRHVVTEAGRVEEAVAAMRANDLAAFGALLRASHASLRDDYEVSVPVLDGLVSIAEGAGASGARLTGAGFGGCIVAVTNAAGAGRVREALGREYYDRQGVENAAFIGIPSEGASLQSQ